MGTTLAPPLIAGRYRLGPVLGRGGMAEVYRAIDLEARQSVALKLLREESEDSAIDRRLLQELLATAQVSHPNLVPVLDFGVAAHRPFFVMELLHGQDLATHYARQGACPADWLLPLFCGALDGLEAVHRQGIVHKDLKPANLFLDQPPGGVQRLRVMDFGIAHHMQRSRATQDGALVCTPRYSSPEYIGHGSVTPASDVYQMGLVLAEGLLGWPMVAEGPFATVAYAHLQGRLQLPPLFVTSPLGQVLQQALAQDPAQRFPSAGSFADALRRLNLEAAQAAAQLHAALHGRQYRPAG